MKRLLIALMLVGMPLLALAKPTKNVFDADIAPGQTVNWVKDTIYVLQQVVYAESGAVVNIQAGTIVKGVDGPPGLCGALAICRGARIYAIGTPYEPIIFTASVDSIEDVTDIPPHGGENLDRGLWGGLLIFGRGCTNSFSPDGVFSEGQIEGVPIIETRARYGGGAACNDDDTSGTLEYVSIRHGGNIFSADNEINGLSMGALGRGTKIDHVEVFANFDDGYEWWGGAVNTKYLISAFNTDDGFDTDEGWRGKNQFWFVLQDSVNGLGNSASERDGGTVPEDSIPLATHLTWNGTYIGSGKTSANVNNNPFINIRDNNASSDHDGIFTDGRRKGLQIEDLVSGEDSRQQLDSGKIVFEHNIWWGFGDDTTLAGNDDKTVFSQNFVRAALWDTLLDAPNATDNRVVDPLLLGISRDPDGGLDPRPAPGSPAYVSPGVPADTFFTNAGFIGAFGPNSCDNTWIGPWTALFQYGYLDTSFTNPWSRLPGDANSSGTYSLSDVISIVNYIFNKSGCSPQPTCWLSGVLCRGDWNGSGTVSLSDVIQAVNFIFNKPNGPWNAVPICPCLNQA